MEIYFLGDKHDILEKQNFLLENIKQYKNCDLWLEFIYPEDLILINKLNKNSDNKAIYQKIKNNLANNNWSDKYNQNIINIIQAAFNNDISVYGLEERKYSLKNFVNDYGNLGFIYYLIDRKSEYVNGCNDRWVNNIYDNMKKNSKCQFILAGNLHQEPLQTLFLKKNIEIKILKVD